MSRVKAKFIERFTKNAMGSWQPAAGAGPIGAFEFDEAVWLFSQSLSHSLVMWLKVPETFTQGRQILMKCGFYSPAAANNFRFQTTATLIRKNTDAVDSTSNQRASTNSDVANSVAKQFREVSFDLTSTTGQINGIGVSAGDLIKVTLSRVSTSGTDDTSDLRMIPNMTEISF